MTSRDGVTMRDAHMATHGDRPTTLYRLYDRARDLLYVGCTCNFLVRMRALSIERRWFNQIKRIHLTPFPARRVALEAERQAIEAENPRFNREGKAEPGDDGTSNWRFKRGLPYLDRYIMSAPEFRAFLAGLQVEGRAAA